MVFVFEIWVRVMNLCSEKVKLTIIKKFEREETYILKKE